MKKGINIFYVYIYIDPRTNSPFYVGKGHNKRYLDHLYSGYNYSINNRIRKIQKEQNQDPEVVIYKNNLSEDEAFSVEMELIRRWGRKDLKTGCLTNLTDGGEGASGSKGRVGTKHSDKTKELLKQRAKERLKDPEKHPMYGKHHTEKSRKLMSKIQKGQGRSYQSIQKQKETIKLNGRVISKETREKISIANTGKVRTQETREKMSEIRKNNPVPNKGKKRTEEQRKRISESQKGLCAGIKNPMYGVRFKWMNNGILNKRVDLDKITEFFQNGWLFGKIERTLVCEFCKKLMYISLYNRRHGNKCKYK